MDSMFALERRSQDVTKLSYAAVIFTAMRDMCQPNMCQLSSFPVHRKHFFSAAAASMLGFARGNFRNRQRKQQAALPCLRGQEEPDTGYRDRSLSAAKSFRATLPHLKVVDSC